MEMNPQASPPTAAPVEQKSIWSIIIGVFTAPTEAFQAYRQKPTIIIPIIVLFVLIAIGSGAVTKYEAMLSYDMFKNSEVIPQESRNQMLDAIENPGYVSKALTGPIFPLIIGLIQALIAMFLGNVVFAGRAKFKAIWGVAILSAMIAAMGGILKVPLVFYKGTLLVSIGLAALMPGKDFTSIMYFFLYSVDVFAIWSIIVGGLGYSVIFGIARGKGMAISGIAFLVLITIIIGMLTTFFSLGGAEISFF